MEGAPAGPRPLESLARGLALLVVLGGIALRGWDLGADPYHYEWNGYITDEGRWIAHARALALFGEIGSVVSPLHLLVAPLFQAASYGVFAAVGVSLWSARLISAVTGSALLVGFWLMARRRASPEALLLALTMLAVEMDTVFLSRLAIPEMAAMFLTFAAFALLAATPPRRLRLVAAGLLTAAAVGMKATVLPVAAIFALIALRRGGAPGLSRGAALGAFAAGVLGPALLAGAALVGSGLAGLPSTAPSLRIIVGFIALTDVYALVAFPFDDALAPVLGLWALAAWVGLLGMLLDEARGDAVPGRRDLEPAVLWAGLYTVTMFLLHYFPARYKLHVLVPLAFIIAMGLTRLQRQGGLQGLGAVLSRLDGLRRLGGALLLAVPTAVVLAAASLAAAAALGIDPERLRTRYAALVLALLAVSVFAWLRRGRGIAVLVWFPLCWAGAWLLAERVRQVSPSFWPGAEADEPLLRWGLLLAAAAGALTAGGASRWGRTAAGGGLVAAAVLYAMLGLARLAPGYLDPHYSMRDVSRDLGARLAGDSGRIAALGGEALFNENRLAYQTIMGRRWPASPPEVLLLAGRLIDPGDRLAREYRLIRHYTIHVSPELVNKASTWDPTVGPFRRTRILVYRRVAGG